MIPMRMGRNEVVMRPRPQVIPIMIGALLLTGCGGGTGGGASPSPSATPTTIPASPSPTTSPTDQATSLTMVDNEFRPSTISSESGGVLLVGNDGDHKHNFTFAAADYSIDLNPGEFAPVNIDVDPGTYRFYCRFHETQGMKGKIRVT
jgi:plastocyanin